MRWGLMVAVVCALAPSVGGIAQVAEESFGCEANPTGNPIGGGEGYTDILTGGDYVVSTRDELLAALKEAQAGQVVFVPDGVEIDLTGCKDIEIPGGVTLAGTRGLAGSLGARLFTTSRASYMLLRTGGHNARVTGLRIEGPYEGREKVAFYAGCLSLNYSNAEIDNCEVYNFNVRGIGIGAGWLNTRIHHNYIHHCQRSGFGYGISSGAGSDVRIIANRFDWCRHHIASGGSPGSGYEAAWNHIGPNANGHHFDMHGGRDRGDNTDIAGDWMHIHHNTFEGTARSVVIRGVPCQGARIHHNWFALPVEKAVASRGNTEAEKNLWGPDKVQQEKPIKW